MSKLTGFGILVVLALIILAALTSWALVLFVGAFLVAIFLLVK